VTHRDTGIASAVRADAARLAPHVPERVARAGQPSNGTAAESGTNEVRPWLASRLED
jgi:hypothetical protein